MNLVFNYFRIKRKNSIEAIIFGDFTKGDEYVEQAIESFCLNHISNIETYKAVGIRHGEVNYSKFSSIW